MRTHKAERRGPNLLRRGMPQLSNLGYDVLPYEHRRSGCERRGLGNRRGCAFDGRVLIKMRYGQAVKETNELQVCHVVSVSARDTEASGENQEVIDGRRHERSRPEGSVKLIPSPQT